MRGNIMITVGSPKTMNEAMRAKLKTQQRPQEATGAKSMECIPRKVISKEESQPKRDHVSYNKLKHCGGAAQVHWSIHVSYTISGHGPTGFIIYPPQFQACFDSISPFYAQSLHFRNRNVCSVIIYWKRVICYLNFTGVQRRL